MTQIIAEIGWNHMGSIDLAKEMISAAKESGAHTAKFQYWNPEKLINGPWDSDGRIEIYKKAYLDEDKIKSLMNFCSIQDINFLISVFDLEDAKILKRMNIKNIKIPSHEAYNLELINYSLSSFEHVTISTGAISKKELDNLKKLSRNYSDEKFTILHCVSSYPCEIKNTNLLKIKRLKKIFKNVGYSDHSQSILVPSLAVMLGAQVIEKHFTTNNELPGRDNKFALEADKFKEMCEMIRNAYDSLTDLGDEPQDSEIDIIKNYRGRWSKKS